MKYIYKSVTFGILFNTKKVFNEKLQELLDNYAKDGWKLHTMEVCGADASVCVCVFEKEVGE